MFADYRHDMCQVQKKKKLLLFWACKSRAVTTRVGMRLVRYIDNSNA